MITTSDIADILYGVCTLFEMDVYRKGYIPDGVVTAERAVILPKEQTPQTFWKKAFVEINLCVPDISEGVANITRLQELERMVQFIFGKDIVGEYEDNYYRVGISSLSGINEDSDLKCHYVNVRLLFEVLNC